MITSTPMTAARGRSLKVPRKVQLRAPLLTLQKLVRVGWLNAMVGVAGLGMAAGLAHADSAGKAMAQPPAPLVKIELAWIRPTVQGQSGTGGFMQITSSRTLSLVGLSTPVAGMAEVHEMAMEGDVMRMRPLDALLLPAGQPVVLKPGGHHLMLTKLKRVLKAGDEVILMLKLRTPEGRALRQQVKVPVSASAPYASAVANTPAAASTTSPGAMAHH